MKKFILLLALLAFPCFADENNDDLNRIKENQEKQIFFQQVQCLLLACCAGFQTVQLMIHAKNQKNLI